MNQFVLKVLWLDKNIAIALDKKIGKTISPITEYFFWPKKDAWEELKIQLEARSWIDSDDTLTLLNQTVKIINFWQTKGTKNNLKRAQKQFPNCVFIGRNSETSRRPSRTVRGNPRG